MVTELFLLRVGLHAVDHSQVCLNHSITDASLCLFFTLKAVPVVVTELCHCEATALYVC